MEHILSIAKRCIPKRIFHALQPVYHFSLSFLGALVYGFPSRTLFLVGVTGTKGKSTTAELVNAILEQAGYKTALASTVRFKIGDTSEPNLFKMTMPGRFFLQRFLHEALRAGCTHAVVEMSSEGVLQFRHRFLYPDALIFTNLAPEHIESHGSFEEYRAAKLAIARRVLLSGKPRRMLILNESDKATPFFEQVGVPEVFHYALKGAEPYQSSPAGSSFSWCGKTIESQLVGTFNIENALAALTLAEALGIPQNISARAIEHFTGVRGRVEKINEGQDFEVVVDYAHTPESLQALYEAFGARSKICVLGGTGGGRDRWKRPEMGRIADYYCSQIFLTNEDPYEENPQQIVDDIAGGITRHTPHLVMDRREAIAQALRAASPGEAVLITGKGTDPYIMEAHNTKTPWDDAQVAREELQELLRDKRT